MQARKQKQSNNRPASRRTIRRQTARVYGLIRQQKRQPCLVPMSLQF